MSDFKESNAINNKKNTSLYKFGKKEISFIIKKISENEFYIWPSVCPHEGASLEDASFCDTSVKCPWHGLSFNAVKLSLKNKHDEEVNDTVFPSTSEHSMEFFKDFMECL